MENELNESAALDEARHDPSRPEFYKTVNPEAEYDGMLMQTGYRHHTANWDQMVNDKAAEMENELNESAALDEARHDPSRPEYYKTVNPESEYDGMLIQRHSALWNQEVDEASERLENEMNEASAWDEARHDPTRPEFYATRQTDNVFDGIYAQLNVEGSGHSKAYMKIQEDAEKQYDEQEKAEALAEEERREEARKSGLAVNETAPAAPVYSQKNTSFSQAEVYDGINLVQL